MWQEKTGKHAGRWRSAISITDAAGKRRRREVYGKTRAEVVKRIKALQQQQSQGVNLVLKQPTVAAFLQLWLDQAIAPNRKARTLESYEDTRRLYINPSLGGVFLHELTPPRVQAWVNALNKTHTTHIARYSAAVLSRACNKAVRWGYIPRNPVSHVDLPPAYTKPITPLTPEEASALLAAVVGHRLEALYTVALALGLRKGEICALRWDDIDWKVATLTVSGSLARIGRGKGNTKLTRSTPKTEGSMTVIPLPTALLHALKKHQQYQREEAALKADDWQEHGMVFASERGTPLEPRNLSTSFKVMLKRAGLSKEVRFHDLRHSCATLLIAQKVPLRVVQAILRHQQISTTANIYGHIYDETHREAVGGVLEQLQSKKG